MLEPEETLKNLQGHEQYLAGFPQSHRSAMFEHLVSQAVASMFHLSLHTASDPVTRTHYVIWHGSLQPVKNAPSGPDATVFAYEFCALVEATMKTGTKQWSQEFATCIEHHKQFVDEKGLAEQDVYLVMVAPQFNNRTWQSVHGQSSIKFVLMDMMSAIKMLETCILAPTTSHSQIRDGLNDLVEIARVTNSLNEFESTAVGKVDSWQKEVLSCEKKAFLAIRSCRAMYGLRSSEVSSGVIYERLMSDPVVERYISLLGEESPRASLIAEIEVCLLDQGLGYNAGRTLPGERIVSPVPFVDFENRMLRFIEEVRTAHV